LFICLFINDHFTCDYLAAARDTAAISRIDDVHLFVRPSVCRQNAKKRIFSNSKQFRARPMLSINDIESRTWAFRIVSDLRCSRLITNLPNSLGSLLIRYSKPGGF